MYTPHHQRMYELDPQDILAASLSCLQFICEWWLHDDHLREQIDTAALVCDRVVESMTPEMHAAWGGILGAALHVAATGGNDDGR